MNSVVELVDEGEPVGWDGTMLFTGIKVIGDIGILLSIGACGASVGNSDGILGTGLWDRKRLVSIVGVVEVSPAGDSDVGNNDFSVDGDAVLGVEMFGDSVRNDLVGVMVKLGVSASTIGGRLRVGTVFDTVGTFDAIGEVGGFEKYGGFAGDLKVGTAVEVLSPFDSTGTEEFKKGIGIPVGSREPSLCCSIDGDWERTGDSVEGRGDFGGSVNRDGSRSIVGVKVSLNNGSPVILVDPGDSVGNEVTRGAFVCDSVGDFVSCLKSIIDGIAVDRDCNVEFEYGTREYN